MSEQKIQIDLPPQSVNSCWRGRRFTTPEYKKWQESFAWLVKGKISPVKWCEVHFTFFVKNFGGRDVDNMIKPTLDSLVKMGCIEDDRYVVEVRARKEKAQGEEGIEITINPV